MNYLQIKLALCLFSINAYTQCTSQLSQTNTSPLNNNSGQSNIQKIITYDTPGRCSEIVSYSKQTNLLLTTNSVSKDITLLSIADFNSGNIQPIDTNPNLPGIQGIKTDGEPTSVAVHPNKNIAFAAVNGSSGNLVAFDLNAAKAGKTKFILNQEIGIHLDSIAISPNGKWLVVADEAEGDPKTPGSIILVDISNLSLAKLPTYKVAGLAEAIGRPAGRVEPEFVSIDPNSKFSAVACQDDNAVVIFPLSKNPRVVSCIKLPRIALPDGANLIQYGANMLLSVAEEGSDTLSIFLINPNKLSQTPRLLSRLDVTKLSGTGGRCDPEGIYMFRQSGKLYLAAAIERADRLLILDISKPSSPVKVASVPVGSRPEGIIVEKQGNASFVITGDEGKPGKGEISIIKVN